MNAGPNNQKKKILNVDIAEIQFGDKITQLFIVMVKNICVKKKKGKNLSTLLFTLLEL